MSRTLLRAAAAALVLLAGFWAAGRIYSIRTAARAPGRVSSPVGAAGAPASSDFAAGSDAAAPPAVKIPDRVPDFSLEDRERQTDLDKIVGRQIPDHQLLGHLVCSPAVGKSRCSKR